MICTVSEFNTYTQNYEDSTEVVTDKTRLLVAAQKVVADHINYDPESTSYTEYFSGIGTNRLYLHSQPITAVTSVVLDGETLDSSDYENMGTYLRMKNGVWPRGIENVLVTYTAGYSSSNVPAIIKQTILQIASLMLEEEGGNIGTTSKSFADSSRTFVNFTNYSKWLDKLEGFVRF